LSTGIRLSTPEVSCHPRHVFLSIEQESQYLYARL
jgi:hypothetical protein